MDLAKVTYIKAITKILQLIEIGEMELAYMEIEELKREVYFPLKIEFDINCGLIERKYKKIETRVDEIVDKKRRICGQYSDDVMDNKQLLLKFQYLLLDYEEELLIKQFVDMKNLEERPYGCGDNEFKDFFISLKRLQEIVMLHQEIEKDTLDKNSPLLFYRLQSLIERYEKGKVNDIFSISETCLKKNLR